MSIIFASRTFNSTFLNCCYNVGTLTHMVYFSIIILVYFSIIIYKLEQNDNVSDMDKQILTDKIRNLLHMMLLRLCYDMFANLSASVGTAGISEIYDKVSKEIIKTPAADVITFTIKSYYEPLKDSDLQEIISKHKNNPVVLNIVRARVRSYVYNHNLDFKRVQRLGDIAGLILLNSPSMALSKKQK